LRFAPSAVQVICKTFRWRDGCAILVPERGLKLPDPCAKPPAIWRELQEDHMPYIIDQMKPSDWPQVARIYEQGIRTGLATFQHEVPTWEAWDLGHVESCRLVVRAGGDILGWAALGPFSKRPVYAGIADVSVYVGENCRGLGIGRLLLNGLVRESEAQGFWTLQSRIIRENVSSIALHQQCGFREVGIKEKMGRMTDGVWHDVVLMERRSKVVGVN